MNPFDQSSLLCVCGFTFNRCFVGNYWLVNLDPYLRNGVLKLALRGWIRKTYRNLLWVTPKKINITKPLGLGMIEITRVNIWGTVLGYTKLALSDQLVTYHFKISEQNCHLKNPMTNHLFVVCSVMQRLIKCKELLGWRNYCFSVKHKVPFEARHYHRLHHRQYDNFLVTNLDELQQKTMHQSTLYGSDISGAVSY